MSPITEPTEEYFKDGLWGWVANQWKKLVADAAGHLQVDVLTSGLPAGGATAANQTTMITALQLIDDLRNALNDVGTDELRTIPYPHGIWGVPGVTQVLDKAQKTNGISSFYTVPSGKTLYLTSLYMQSFNNGAGDATGRVLTRDASDVIISTWRLDCLQTQQLAVYFPFSPPLKIPEDYDIVLDSDNAGYTINATITGYTI